MLSGFLERGKFGDAGMYGKTSDLKKIMNWCAENEFQGQTLTRTRMMLRVPRTFRTSDLLNKLSRIMLYRVLRLQVWVFHPHFLKL